MRVAHRRVAHAARVAARLSPEIVNWRPLAAPSGWSLASEHARAAGGGLTGAAGLWAGSRLAERAATMAWHSRSAAGLRVRREPGARLGSRGP